MGRWLKRTRRDKGEPGAGHPRLGPPTPAVPQDFGVGVLFSGPPRCFPGDVRGGTRFLAVPPLLRVSPRVHIKMLSQKISLRFIKTSSSHFCSCTH